MGFVERQLGKTKLSLAEVDDLKLTGVKDPAGDPYVQLTVPAGVIFLIVDTDGNTLMELSV
jgi:hypothetical protein